MKRWLRGLSFAPVGAKWVASVTFGSTLLSLVTVAAFGAGVARAASDWLGFTLVSAGILLAQALILVSMLRLSWVGTAVVVAHWVCWITAVIDQFVAGYPLSAAIGVVLVGPMCWILAEHCLRYWREFTWNPLGKTIEKSWSQTESFV